MDILALIISIIALIISCFDIYYSWKINKTNLKSEYFLKFYTDYLFERIPMARNKVQIVDGSFIGFQDLQNAITDMVFNSAFFKYSDEDFYNQLKIKCIALEDYLLNTANKKNIKLYTPYDDIDGMIRDIYEHINNKYEKG